MQDAEILTKARNTIDERVENYGPPTASWKEIAMVASELTGRVLSSKDCVKVLMSMKLVRERYKHTEDNLLDLVAYTQILHMLEEGE